jgi:hypothetical protein
MKIMAIPKINMNIPTRFKHVLKPLITEIIIKRLHVFLDSKVSPIQFSSIWYIKKEIPIEKTSPSTYQLVFIMKVFKDKHSLNLQWQ